MTIEKDIDDIQSFIDGIQAEVVDHLYDLGVEALNEQRKRMNIAYVKPNFTDHTFNLRNSGGIVVFWDGVERKRHIANQGHSDPRANAETNQVLNAASKTGTGMVVAFGMKYASFVESKGFNVRDTAQLHLKKSLQ